jgi:hypothetical protein
MNRLAFIKNLLGLGAGAVMLPTYDWINQYDKFYLLQSFVRGFKYYAGPALLPQMNEGDMLQLVREPQNEYDEFAIALHYNQQKIGFVPAESNDVLSKLLDIGVIELTAEITHLNKEASAWENVVIAIYVLKERKPGNELTLEAQQHTVLETPHYYSVKSSGEKVTRFYLDDSDTQAYELPPSRTIS